MPEKACTKAATLQIKQLKALQPLPAVASNDVFPEDLDDPIEEEITEVYKNVVEKKDGQYINYFHYDSFNKRTLYDWSEFENELDLVA